MRVYLLLASLWWCGSAVADAAQICCNQAHAAIGFTAAQRETAMVPGFAGRVKIVLGDITDGQVRTRVLIDDSTLFGPSALRPGHSLEFTFENKAHQVVLEYLDNVLIGQDFAHFRVQPTALQLSEAQRIDALIIAVQSLENAKFLRNGKSYSGLEAAAHLRQKRAWQAAQIHNAEDFIALCASRSSETGQLYMIRFSNGSEVAAGDFLRARLQQMSAR